MAKKFESGLRKPTDAEVFAATKGIPFGTCKQCGLRVVTNAVLCPECERLEEIGFGPVPRTPNVHPGQDTTPVQSFDAFNHKGYKDQIPSGKVPPNKERV